MNVMNTLALKAIVIANVTGLRPAALRCAITCAHWDSVVPRESLRQSPGRVSGTRSA